MSKITVVSAFALGVTVGFLASRQYFSDKYQKIADEEIESVRARFSGKQPAKDPPPLPKVVNKPLPDRPSVEPIALPTLPRRNYNTCSSPAEGQEIITHKPTITQRKPRVISPEEFGEVNGYEQISLTYYSDFRLADDAGAEMSDADIKKTIGEEALSSFGEYEDDSVFVRNDDLKTDYEILLDHRTYAEVVKQNPTLEDN